MAVQKTKTIHLYCRASDNKWMIKKDDAKRASFGFMDQSEAEEKAKSLAQELSAKLIIKNPEGGIDKEVHFEAPVKRANQHVIKQKNLWVVKSEGARGASHKYASKNDAIEKAKEIAREQSTLMVVHKNDGRVQQMQDLRGTPYM